MPARLVASLVGALVLLISACPSDGGGSKNRDAGDDGDAALGGGMALPADVDAVLENRCRKCHSDPPKNFAPFPLVTFENVHAPAPAHDGAAIYEVIAERIHDANFPMPPDGNPITDADRKVLDDWIAAGAPAAK